MKTFKSKPCKRCGDIFTPTHPCNTYCSIECRGQNAYYRRNYGLSQDNVECMVSYQGHRCYLCEGEGFILNPERHSQKLVVDHCHETGTIRKMLCHNCNRALGLMKDNPELLRKAADYIEQHR